MKLAIIDLQGLPYDARTIHHRGLGGSESAVIYMSAQLQKLGWQVTVFCNCEQGDDTAPGVYDGVTYLPIENLRHHACDFDVVVSSRTVEPWVPVHMRQEFTRRDMTVFDRLHTVKCHRVLWMHDTFCYGDHVLEHLVVNSFIHEVFTLSDWHLNYILNCEHGPRRNYEVLKNRTFLTRNGVNSWLDWVDPSQKDPNLYVYNASVSKGMTPLLERVWPQFKAQVPDAKLKIIGGYYRFRPTDPPDEQEQQWHKLRDTHHGHQDVQFTGIITQQQIAHTLAEASMMMYPGAFPETFGISALESLNYLTPLLTNRFGGLEEIAMDQACYKMDYAIEPNVLFTWIPTDAQVARFVQMAVQAHHNRYLLQQKQHYCRIVKPLIGWDKVALQWDQHFARILDKPYPVQKYRHVSHITHRWQQVFGRRFTNVEDHVTLGGSEQPMLVISCMRNGATYVKRCIESVAAQDYDNYIQILVDDASDDDTSDQVARTIQELPEHMQHKFVLWRNETQLGAPQNQHRVLSWAKSQGLDPNTIVMILDGDDHLVSRNHIFKFYNRMFDLETEFTYGSCWSMADQIPLVAQEYPPEVKRTKSYRQHRFNWLMPYTHLRAFRLHLFDTVQASEWQNHRGEWYQAGGDTAVFYSLIERADPDKVKAVQDIVVNYNDVNPLNDYKIHPELQNVTASEVLHKIPMPDTHTLDSHSTKSQVMMPEAEPLPPQHKRIQRILIGVPTARYIEVDTFKSIYDLITPPNCEIHFQYFWGYNVEQVRNIMVNWMLQNQFDYMLCVDSDIILPPDTLVKLLAAQTDSVGITSGVYIQRKEGVRIPEIYVTNPRTGGHENLHIDAVQGNARLQVAGVGFGCCLVHRRVFEAVGNPWFVYRSNIEFDKVVSEDVDFCVKATHKGFGIVVDTSVKCGHMHKTILDVNNP